KPDEHAVGSIAENLGTIGTTALRPSQDHLPRGEWLWRTLRVELHHVIAHQVRREDQRARVHPGPDVGRDAHPDSHIADLLQPDLLDPPDLYAGDGDRRRALESAHVGELNLVYVAVPDRAPTQP